MSNVYLDDSILTGISNAIRAKSGGSSLITPANMATEISNLSISGGSNDLTISRVYGTATLCRYNNSVKDYILPISDYLPDDLNELKVLIGISEVNTGGYGIIWYNNSSNLITATVSEYVNSSGQVKTDAGTVPVLINSYGFKIGYGSSEDRNPDIYGDLALINGQLYTVQKSGNNYIYNRVPDPYVEDNTNWFIVKEV